MPSKFLCLINDVLQDMLGKFVMTYIDNILIYSTLLETHILHVKQMLTHVLQKQLYVKGEKCKFLNVFKISFLGYIISPEGIP